MAEIAGEWVSEADLVQVDVDDQAPADPLRRRCIERVRGCAR
ncbi:hypothetical protein [Streptomyces noursei]